MQKDHTTDYSMLMTSRIHRILLVCNNYDSFTLEEDGRIEAQIAQEYSDLNLSNPPAIIRAQSTVEALNIARAGEEHYDLVITMYNVGKVDVFEFSRQFKALSPDTPIVLLSSYSKEIFKQIRMSDEQSIDYVFCWNNSTDLIVAIIKLIEDSMNAEHDIHDMGVQAILLVEDSVRYYSTYLPVLYKMILEQNRESIRDALNEQQMIFRKRSRPKILMASNYSDAVALYEKYKTNLLGIISDVGFVVNRHDDPATEKLDAGIDFCHLVKSDNSMMPFLLQSSQESLRSIAEELGVGFIVKNSKTLTHELREYISREFGFGDFVVTDEESGEEIARASDLYGLEKLMRTMPDDIVYKIAIRNYMSKWLLSRGIFKLGNLLKSLDARAFEDIPAIRKIVVDSIKDFRIQQGLGVVAKFDPETYNSTLWFTRLGNGSIGGKARGLAFLNHMIQKYDLFQKWDGVHVRIPRTLAITTEYFDRFIIENGLQYVINSDITDDEILSEFVASTLPAELTNALKVFVKHTHKPLAVRSSSKLEDSYYQPFAGVYSTYMLPHTENEDQQIRLLSKAIKSVYASVYFASSRSYIAASGNMISEEKMGVVIQEVCGSEDQGYFFPTLSGVARSINFYPVGNEKADEGIAKIAFGLGKAVVDGDKVLRFSPRYPSHIIQTSTPEHIMSDTQQTMYALNLRPEKFKTSIDDGVNLEKIEVSDCSKFRNLKLVSSTWDFNNMRMVDTPYANGPKFVTFSHILKYNTFPLADILVNFLNVAQEEMKCPVEIEFAANLDRQPGKAKVFNILQIRPISADTGDMSIDWNGIDTSGSFVESSSALGTGWVEGIHDIIYLRKEAFNILKTREMADQIREMNNKMLADGSQYILAGYGRWGSSIPSLGVPVKWSDICAAKAIVESSLKNLVTEPSQGTHFFQNLTSFNVGYINVDPEGGKGKYDVEVLDALPAVEETEYIRHIHLDKPLQICIDGMSGKAFIKLGE